MWTPKVGEKFNVYEKHGQFEGHAHRLNPFICTGLDRDNRKRVTVVYAGACEFYTHVWRFERTKSIQRNCNPSA